MYGCVHTTSVFTKYLFLDRFCTELYSFLFFKLTAIFHLKMFLKLWWRLHGNNPAVLQSLSFKVRELQRVDSICYIEDLLMGDRGATSAHLASSLLPQWQFITMWQDVLFKVRAEKKHGISLEQKSKAPMEVFSVFCPISRKVINKHNWNMQMSLTGTGLSLKYMSH